MLHESLSSDVKRFRFNLIAKSLKMISDKAEFSGPTEQCKPACLRRARAKKKMWGVQKGSARFFSPQTEHGTGFYEQNTKETVFFNK